MDPAGLDQNGSLLACYMCMVNLVTAQSTEVLSHAYLASSGVKLRKYFVYSLQACLQWTETRIGLFASKIQ